MKREEIGRLYDHEYAASYDEKFLLSPLHISDTRHEVELLRSFLTPQVTWLDVACGTGYFLRQFPEIPRAGIDLSPAMLERARAANAGVELGCTIFVNLFRNGRIVGGWYPACGTPTVWSTP